MSGPRVGRRQLEAVSASLGERDSAILTSLAANRFLTTGQICRLHFSTTGSGAKTSLRRTNRALAKLGSLQLIDALERRVGGVRAGSASYVWFISPLGGRLLQMAGAMPERQKWQRQPEPSLTFLHHTLAVAEVSVRLSEAQRRGEITVLEVQREPESWRTYTGSGGVTTWVKPDLALVTAVDDFEDHWFLEIDLATEHPSRVIRTCLAYQAYLRSGEEQRRLGIFPAVVWIVPTTKRKDVLLVRMADERKISANVFHVILLDELVSLLSAGTPAEPEEAAS